MEASPTKVIQYFNGEKQNLIPLFQRPYTWKKDNWQTLWDDIMVQYDVDENSTHFMGAIVSVPARSVPVGVSKFLIIDGQQRLTTVSLLLCALRDSLDNNSASRIHEVYLTNKYRPNDDAPKFVPTQTDRDDYLSIAIDRTTRNGNSLIVQAYDFYRTQLKTALDFDGNLVDPAKVLSTVEYALQVVMINLDETDDPYLIFESLNFKGEPLNQADLVRNYVLMKFNHSVSTGGEQERIFVKYWHPLEDNLGDNLAGFLRHYSMKDGDNIRQGGIYAAVKAKFKKTEKPTEIEDEIQKMFRFGEFYARLLKPELENTASIQTRLRNINELQVTTSYPLLLRLFDARANGKIDNNELEKCLGLLEAFVVRRSVCAVPTNSLNKLFLQWTKNFPQNDHVSWLLNLSSSGSGGRRFPSDTEFSEAFQTQPQYGLGTTRFILCRFEKSYGHKEVVDLGTATIEHVMPQTLTPEWQSSLEEESDAKAVEVHQRLVDTFGNLTLTGYNSELGNISFPEKKLKLNNTHIELNRFILEKQKWRSSEIAERAGRLAEIAKKLWPGPSGGTL